MIILQLRSGASVNDGSDDGLVFKRAVDALEKRSDVCRVYWGSGLENSEILHLHIGMPSKMFTGTIRLTTGKHSKREASPAL